MVQMYRGNLISALLIAIETRRAIEKQHGFTGDSIFVAGLVEVVESLKRDEEIQVLG